VLHAVKMPKPKKPEAFLTLLQEYLHYSAQAFFPFCTVSLVLCNCAHPDHDKNRFRGKLEGSELPWYSGREVIPVSQEDRPRWMQHRTSSSLQIPAT